MPRKQLRLAVDSAETISGPLIGADTFSGDGLVVDQDGIRLGDGAAVQPRGSAPIAFSDLEVQKRLGSGASATVHLARHRGTGASFALKLINVYDKGAAAPSNCGAGVAAQSHT
jgi:hypothetical protein